MRKFDVVDTPYEIYDVDVKMYQDRVLIAVCHEHGIVAPIAITEDDWQSVMAGEYRLDEVPWDAAVVEESRAVEGDVRRIAEIYGYDVADELCEH